VKRLSLSHNAPAYGCKFFGNLVLAGDFRKFSVTVNITDNLGTSVDLNETMHATTMRTINHKNNVLMLLLVHYWTPEVL